jgi:glycosyltransferase involved in cell wall biosynthesis
VTLLRYMSSMKRILMVAYHFPPLAGSSGIQRTLRFSKYLPELGWQPLILAAQPRAYDRISMDQMADVRKDIVVVRAAAFDAARHFALAGHYPSCLARPDRWVSWLPGAVYSGLSMIRRYKPNVIWSTYPIATAHWIGAVLSKLSGIPWVADFRDPMVQDGYPSDRRIRRSFKKIEERALKNAALSTFTTPGAVRFYTQRYPNAAGRIKLLENGYDEEAFSGLQPDPSPLNPGKITLLHSGIIYPSERDPTQFMQAIRRLIDAGRISADQLRVRFRAPAHNDFLYSLIEKFNLAEQIQIMPPVPYREALAEMMRADVLLIMQASNCNDQIPAKLYEYLRSGRPIVALTDPLGDTANTLRGVGIHAISPLDNRDEIVGLLSRIIAEPSVDTIARTESVEVYSRMNLTRIFSSLLAEVAATAHAGTT